MLIQQTHVLHSTQTALEARLVLAEKRFAQRASASAATTMPIPLLAVCLFVTIAIPISTGESNTIAGGTQRTLSFIAETASASPAILFLVALAGVLGFAVTLWVILRRIRGR
jgi:hypothetical protein